MSTKILFLVLPHTNLLDLSGAVHVFHEAKEKGMDIEVDYCSYEDNLKTSVGLPLGKMSHYKKQVMNEGDYVFIPSVEMSYLLSKDFKPQKALIDWLIQSHEKGAIICAFCTSAFLLGLTGLLDNRKSTTHWKYTNQLQTKFPLTNVCGNLIFIEDDGIYTSAGATSGIDVALHILHKLKGDYFTFNIARELVIYNRRNGNDKQQTIFTEYRNHVHAGIHKVQDWLQQNLHKKVSLIDLAEIANMSCRNFTRIFKKETSLTVNEYINLLRREKISELIKQPDLSRMQIAKHCGLSSERHVSRLIHKR